MSVDFFDCRVCGQSVCECGHFVRCDCGNKWCDEECAESEGYRMDSEETDEWEASYSCDFCRNEDYEDITLLKYALSLLGKDRQELIKMYNESHN